VTISQNDQKRILGIDVARALAVCGMILVNFKVVLGAHGTHPFMSITSFLEGKAAATFVVLAGVGIALSTRDKNRNKQIIRLLKRAVLLFIIGCSYLWIWPADILHFYGIYILISVIFLASRPKVIFLAALLFILLFPILLFIFPYEQGWNFESLEYSGLWTFNGFLRHLFYNGFHPVIPWTGFMLIGLWLGKYDLRDPVFLRKMLIWSSSIFIITTVVSKVLEILAIDIDPSGELATLVSTSPMPPMPTYMISGSAFAISTITVSIIITNRLNNAIVISSLIRTGKLALTFYVAHVLIGMGAIELFSEKSFGFFSARFSFYYAILFCVLCIVFATVWLRFFKYGPLEWIFRMLSR